MRYIALVLLVAVLAGCGTGGTTQSSAASSPSANAAGSRVLRHSPAGKL